MTGRQQRQTMPRHRWRAWMIGAAWAIGALTAIAMGQSPYRVVEFPAGFSGGGIGGLNENRQLLCIHNPGMPQAQVAVVTLDAQGQLATYRDLYLLDAPESYEVVGFNNRGDVLVTYSAAPPPPYQWCTWWRRARLNLNGGGVSELSFVGPHEVGWRACVDDSGRCHGPVTIDRCFSGDEGSVRLFIGSEGGVPNLQVPPPIIGYSGGGWHVCNNQLDVVFPTANNGLWMWTNGGYHNLGIGTPRMTYPIAMNETGQLLANFPDLGWPSVVWTDSNSNKFVDEGESELVTPLPGTDRANAYAITGLGRLIGNCQLGTGPKRPCLWTQPDQPRDLSGAVPAPWVLDDALDISSQGWILARAHRPGESPRGVILLPDPDYDTDGDGLSDDWEDHGIPYDNGFGVTVRYRLPEADREVRNLYVEVDCMAGVQLSPEAIQMVVDAFASAPPRTPGETSGIRLHVRVSDTSLPAQDVTPSLPNQFPANATGLRAQSFGTESEQGFPEMLTAKAKAFRYCLVMKRSSQRIGGHAEVGGDDMILYLDGYTVENQAAVFMHELGHNLNLNHGGVDAINGKPNYPSIMNYMLSYSKPWNERFWRLDFCRHELPTLNEASLNETSHVGHEFYRGFRMPFHTAATPNTACYNPTPPGQPTIAYLSLSPTATADFNVDCDETDAGLVQDLTYMPGSALEGTLQPSPNEPLVGCNDWARIVLKVSNGGGGFASAPPADELTEQQLAWMEATFPPPPCRGDWDADGIVQPSDVSAFVTAWFGSVSNGTLVGDFDHDQAVLPQDVSSFVSEWFANLTGGRCG